MKKQEFVQIKRLDVKELKGKAKTLQDEIANLTLDKNMKKLKDLKMVSKKKKELAQVLTIIRQKEELSVLNSQLSDNSQSVISESVTDKKKIEKPKSEDRKQKTDSSRTGGKK